MAAVRLRQALDRALAVFSITTTTHHAQSSDDTNAAALAVVPVASDGTAAPVGTAADPQSVVGNVASGAADSGNPVKVGGVYNAVTPTPASGQRLDLQINANGALMVEVRQGNVPPSTPTSGADGESNSSAVAGMRVYSRNSVFNGTTWDRQAKPNAVSRLLSSAATTNATSVKGSAGNLFKVTGNNTVASKRYLKLYNKATAPTVGTDTPVLTFVLLASAAFTIDLPSHYFSTGIAYAITTAAADADTGALGVGDIECLNIEYA